MYWDFETSTYMTPNRHLNPRTGRWTQPDPFFHALHGNLQSCIMQAGNLYMFVMHNPVMFVDPLGLYAVIAYYIARKNQGTFSAIIDPSGVNTRVTIQIGDITHTFGHSDIISSSSRILMHHGLLMSTFGLSFEQATH